MASCALWRKRGVLPFCLFTWLATAVSSRAVVYDFSGPLDITASTIAGGVSLSAFDPVNGPKSLNVGSGTTFDLISANGVAAWSSGTHVYYYTYDPIRTNWVGESFNSGATFDLKNAKGTVAWSAGATVYCFVYDRQRAAWRGVSANFGSTVTLSLVDNVVSWSVGGAGGGVAVRTYDPARGDWPVATVPGTTADLVNRDGVVAWSSSGTALAYVYDPLNNGWRGASVPSGIVSGLRNQQGVVAWVGSAATHFMTYHAARSNWFASSVASGYTPTVTISNATVTWATASQSYVRGFNPSNATWYAGPSLPFAWFTASTNHAAPPLYVYFGDLSFGGNSWSWDLGAGFGSSTKRSPSVRYTGLNRFLVTQSVTGLVANSSTNLAIRTDTVAPFGTLLINGGESFTTNATLNLTLSATDNSGVVDSMRFSNDGTNWTSWEAYATSRVWTVSTGVNTNTVFAQFRDPAGNASTNATDSIVVDTTPLPVLSLASTNVSEAVGTASLRLSLDRALSRPVVVHVTTTTNGTATPGQDFTPINLDVTFDPGVTQRFVNVAIANDGLVELNETIEFAVTSISNAIVGPLGALTITDNDLPAVSFAAANFSALESSGAGLATLSLSQPSSTTVSLRVQTAPGTATAGVDFPLTNLLVNFAPGQTNQTVFIPINNDADEEPHETVLLTLNSVTNALLAAPTNATLTIIDDEPPRVFLARDAFIVSESAGVAFVSVQLSKPFSQPVFVDCLAVGGSAASGVDYVPKSETLQFAPDQTNKTVLVTLFDNANRGPAFEKTVNLTLENVSGGTLGVRDTARIVIRDDDQPPQLTAPGFVTTNRFLRLTLVGAPAQVFNVEGSSALPGFTNLATLTNTTGTVEFTDTTVTNAPQRYYRSSLAP